ncbi:MAG TPA: PGPGW domain-containing protein [Rubrobacteraceae bacterium]|nr:PGPGW domain-containing protein [Rubrobacteraceae bacterium]
MILCIFGGFLLVVGGVIAVPGPGPGWLIILLGLWMLAGELLFLARFMDRVEVRLSKLLRCVIGIWTTSSALVKGLFTLMILVCVAAMGYGTIIWFV